MFASRIGFVHLCTAGLCDLKLIFLRTLEEVCMEMFPLTNLIYFLVICMCLIAECMSRNWDISAVSSTTRGVPVKCHLVALFLSCHTPSL